MTQLLPLYKVCLLKNQYCPNKSNYKNIQLLYSGHWFNTNQESTNQQSTNQESVTVKMAPKRITKLTVKECVLQCHTYREVDRADAFTVSQQQLPCSFHRWRHVGQLDSQGQIWGCAMQKGRSVKRLKTSTKYHRFSFSTGNKNKDFCSLSTAIVQNVHCNSSCAKVKP